MNYIFVLDLILEFKNITVKELSVDTGISESYLYNIVENKKKNIGIDKLYKISEVLNAKPRDFFYAENDFEEVQEKMHKMIDEKGLNSPEALYFSKVLDRILILKMKQ